MSHTETITCSHCNTEQSVSYANIPVYGITLVCKDCVQPINVYKPDDYYKRHFSEPIATYILHHINRCLPSNLALDIKIITAFEKYFNSKGRDILFCTKYDIAGFIDKVRQKSSDQKAKRFLCTIKDFYASLEDANIVATYSLFDEVAACTHEGVNVERKQALTIQETMNSLSSSHFASPLNFIIMPDSKFRSMALLDLGFILALVLSSTYFFLMPLLLSGVFISISNIYMISRSICENRCRLPYYWFIPVVLFPFTFSYFIKSGLWFGEDDHASLCYKSGLSFLIVLMLAVSWILPHSDIYTYTVLQPMDEQTSRYLNDTAVKATTAYTTSRAINASISTFHQNNVTANVSPEIVITELINPVNDIIERFSGLMLIATTSIGIQEVLHEIGMGLGLTLFLSFAMLIYLISLWIGNERLKAYLRKCSVRIAILAVVIRMAIPLVSIIGLAVSSVFLDNRYSLALDNMVVSRAEISDNFLAENRSIGVNGSGHPEKEPMLNNGKHDDSSVRSDKRYAGDAGLMNVIGDNYAILQEQAKVIIDSVISLIMLFTFEAVVLPLLIVLSLIKIFSLFIGFERRYWEHRAVAHFSVYPQSREAVI